MDRFVAALATLACLTACTTSTRHTRDWQQHGVKIVHGSDLDLNTAQTPGMTRAAAINNATAGASKLWAGVPTRRLEQPGALIEPDRRGRNPRRSSKFADGALIIHIRRPLRWPDTTPIVVEHALVGDSAVEAMNVELRVPLE